MSILSRTRAALALSGVLALLCASCGNVFRDFPEKDSDSYRIDATRNALDAENFDNAIAEISPVLTAQPKNSEVVYLASVAYAGRAGLRILNLFSEIANAAATTGILTIFAKHFTAASTDDLADFESAVSIVQAYSDFAMDRDTDLNFYAIFLYYARIGVILNHYAFDNSVALRSNFKACHTVEDLVGASTGIPNAMLDKIYISIPRIVDIVNTIALGSQFGGLTNLSALPTLPKAALPCSATPNNVNCLAVRSLVNVGPSSGGIGLGSGGVCAVTTP